MIHPLHLLILLPALFVTSESKSSTFFLRVNMTQTIDFVDISNFIAEKYPDGIHIYTLNKSRIDLEVISSHIVSQQRLGVLKLVLTSMNESDYWNENLKVLQGFMYYKLRFTHNLTLNGVGFDIYSLKIYKTSQAAIQDVYAINAEYCSVYGCQTNQICVNTPFLPVCIDFWDFGTYFDGTGCVSCPFNKTTLQQQAYSINHCVESCDTCYYYDLESSSCKECPYEYYWDNVQRTCLFCPIVSNEFTTCGRELLNYTWHDVGDNDYNKTDVKETFYNQRVHIDVNLTLSTSSCSYNNFSEEMINDRYYATTFIRDMISSTGSHRIFEGLCLPSLNYCYNLEAKIIKSQVCVPDTSCSGENCHRFKTRLLVMWFYAWNYTQTKTINCLYRSSKDVALEYLWTLKRTSNFWLELSPLIELPVNAEMTYVDVERRRVYIKYTVNSNSEISDAGYKILEELKKRVAELACPEVVQRDLSSMSELNSTLLFKSDVDDFIVNTLADALIQMHELFLKSSSSLAFSGPIYIYRTYSNALFGQEAVNWCDVVNRLALVTYFCDSGDTCVSVDSQFNFTCRDSQPPRVVNFTVNGDKSVYLRENGSADFFCQVDGIPTPTAYLNGSFLSKIHDLTNSSNVVSYRVTNVSCNDSGRYFCYGRNGHENVSSFEADYVDINVTCKPRLLPSEAKYENESKEVRISVDSNTKFTVIIYGYPEPTQYILKVEKDNVFTDLSVHHEVTYTKLTPPFGQVSVTIYDAHTRETKTYNLNIKNEAGTVDVKFNVIKEETVGPTSGGDDVGTKVGIGVGVGLGVLLLATAIIVTVCIVRRRRLKKTPTQPPQYFNPAFDKPEFHKKRQVNLETDYIN